MELDRIAELYVKCFSEFDRSAWEVSEPCLVITPIIPLKAALYIRPKQSRFVRFGTKSHYPLESDISASCAQCKPLVSAAELAKLVRISARCVMRRSPWLRAGEHVVNTRRRFLALRCGLTKKAAFCKLSHAIRSDQIPIADRSPRWTLEIRREASCSPCKP